MSVLLSLNLFVLFVLCVKIERAVHLQLDSDNDDDNYNDWNFGFGEE